MKYEPSPFQTLFLWRLLSAGGGGFQKDMKPSLEPAARRALENAGLIHTEGRRRQAPGRRPGRANYISLTEAGWAWSAENLDAEVYSRSPAAGPILQDIMSRLKTFLGQRQFSLAEFISDIQNETVTATAENGADLPNRIDATYRRLTGYESAHRVRLQDLRADLNDLPREHLDDTLLEMEREGRLVLFPLDNPQEVGPEDSEAALANSAGQPRHVMYIGERE